MATKSPDDCPPPNADAAAWMIEYWNIGSEMNYFLKAIITFQVIDFFFVINIGNALMTAMGQLSIELTSGVKEIYELEKTFCSCYYSS